jgi:HlyD family secretion protein
VKRGLVWGTVILALVGVAGAAYLFTTNPDHASGFRTAKVDRGVIVVTVSATGQPAPVTTVLVGTQVSGQIKELFVDFNSRVEKGQLIARIDPDIFQAKVAAARADLENAQAAVLNQRANVEKVRADVEYTRANATSAEANVERARADVEQARASAVSAEAKVEQARADVENARALIATAQATVARESATAANARRELDRRIVLLRRDLIAQSDKDQAQTAFETAQAQLEAAHSQERAGQAALRSAEAQLEATRAQAGAAQAARRSAEAQVVAMASQARAALAVIASAEAAFQVAQAQLKAAEASVRQKQAALDQARLDLRHTEIRAPVTGVVVSRNVDVGQTVAASLQAPTLFSIAEDLTRMEVDGAVDEADIGRLRHGMPATFTVDAFPGRAFRGEIVQIRQAPQVIQNVVTYTTVITVPNPERILMPGMTANVRIQVERREGVVRVPNAALRFRPAGATGAGGGVPAGSGPGPSSLRELRGTLVRELALTAEQQTRLDAILSEADQAFRELGSQALDERAHEAQRRRLRAETLEKIRAILTPGQQVGYERIAVAEGGTEAAAGSSARVFVPGTDGTPKAVPIVVGLTDGTYSEVRQGSLQPGQEVIVGESATQSPPGASPQLRM